MKKLWLLLLPLLAVLASCSKDPIAEGPKDDPMDDPKVEIYKGIVVGLPDIKDNYYVESVYGKNDLNNGQFDLDVATGADSKLVLYILKNSGGYQLLVC